MENSIYWKYPRTFHLPTSEESTSDDKIMKNLSFLEGQEVVVTEKMDGENTSLYKGHIHARSINSGNHPSRDWVKSLWSGIRHEIPEGWKICGENLFAKHSIFYKNLKSYFYVFNIWNKEKVALSWDETVEYADILGLEVVPVVYRGKFDLEKIHTLWEALEHPSEGYVVRVTDSIDLKEWPLKAGKWVRKGHVQTETHWMHQEIIKNECV